MTVKSNIDPQEAKKAILEYCLKKGALIAGVADINAVNRIAPEGHRPSDLWPRAKVHYIAPESADRRRAPGQFLQKR